MLLHMLSLCSQQCVAQARNDDLLFEMRVRTDSCCVAVAQVGNIQCENFVGHEKQPKSAVLKQADSSLPASCFWVQAFEVS